MHMRNFHFQIIVTTKDFSLDDMETDVASIFSHLQDETFIDSISITCDGPLSWDALITTELLTIEEVEVLILESFSSTRELSDYIIVSNEVS